VAQNTNYNYDSWCLAISYSYGTRMTTGFFCAQDNLNPSSIIMQLIASNSLSIHPMLLPSILFQKLLESSHSHRDNLLKDIQTLENRLGYVEGHDGTKDCSVTQITDKEKLYDASYYRDLSIRLNTCKKKQASRDGRAGFWKQFREVLLAAMDELDTSYGQDKDMLGKCHQELKHWVSGNGKIFESLDGRDVNYRARIETQLNVVCRESIYPMSILLILAVALQFDSSKR
jgi:hypothetical protein